ncbi:Fe-S cluster biosynthesis and repair protein YggX [Lachnospiraceae bacterium PFB1-21]
MQNYRQTDSKWRNYPYAGSTMGIAGCGPTSVADIVDKLPTEIADYMQSHGYGVSGHGTAWNGINKTLDTYGHPARQLSDPMEFLDRIKSGKSYGIVLVGQSPWTGNLPGGHFFVVTAVNANNDIHVHDPIAIKEGWMTWGEVSPYVNLLYLCDRNGKEEIGLRGWTWKKNDKTGTLDIGISYYYAGDNAKRPARFVWEYYDTKKKMWGSISKWTDSNWITMPELPTGDYLINVKMFDDSTTKSKKLAEKAMGIHIEGKGAISASHVLKQDMDTYLMGAKTTDPNGYVTIKIYDVEADKWFNQATVNNKTVWADFDLVPGRAYWALFVSYNEKKEEVDRKLISFIA